MFGDKDRHPFFEIFDNMPEMEIGMHGRVGMRDAEVIDSGEEYKVSFDMAGFSEDDIQVRLLEDERIVRVSASNESDEIGAKKTVRKSRRIPKDGVVDEGEIATDYNNGMVVITIPKKETEEEGVEIDIE